MIHPTIHRNGTDKKDLVEQWNDAYKALHDALAALQYARPNGRDYYPQGPEAIQTAETEHCLRIMKIRSVMEDIDKLRAHVMFDDTREPHTSESSRVLAKNRY